MPAFGQDVATIAGKAGRPPDPHHGAQGRVPDVERAVRALDAADARQLPLHVLIESPAAVHRAFRHAAHPRVQSLSFGLMDFVSAHGGAIPRLTACPRQGSSATRWWCAPSWKSLRPPRPRQGALALWSRSSATPGHAGRRSARARVWLHPHVEHPPAQIRPILEAFAPDTGEIETATEIIAAAAGRPTGLPSALAASCATVRATVTFGRCWSAAHQTGQAAAQRRAGLVHGPARH